MLRYAPQPKNSEKRSEPWQTSNRKSVGIRCAHVHRNQAASIAAPRAKAPAKRLNWTAIAVTTGVRAISSSYSWERGHHCLPWLLRVDASMAGRMPALPANLVLG